MLITFFVSSLMSPDGQVVQLPAKYIPDEVMYEIYDAQDSADSALSAVNAIKADPSFTGSFSQNRKENTTIGENSHVEGYNCTAIGHASHAEGKATTANAEGCHAEGGNTIAGKAVQGSNGSYSHAEGFNSVATGNTSHAEGTGTIAQGAIQHVQGRFNIPNGKTAILDPETDFVHIVGNGTSDDKRSNAHTLTFAGVPWYQGRLQFGGNAMNDGAQTVMANGDKELIIQSSTTDSTKKFKITVDDSGTISATEITT